MRQSNEQCQKSKICFMLAFAESKYATWTALHRKRPLKRKRVPTFFSSQFVRNVRGEIITVLHTWQNIIFRI